MTPELQKTVKDDFLISSAEKWLKERQESFPPDTMSCLVGGVIWILHAVSLIPIGLCTCKDWLPRMLERKNKHGKYEYHECMECKRRTGSHPFRKTIRKKLKKWRKEGELVETEET